MRKGVQKSPVAAEVGSDEQAHNAPSDTPLSENTLPSNQPLSEKKSTEKNKKKTVQPDRSYLDDMFQNASSIFVAVDEDFHVFDINPAAAEKLRHTTSHASAQSCMSLLQCRNLNGTVLCGTSNCPLVRVLQGDHTISNEELLIGVADARSNEYSVNITPVRAGLKRGALFTGRDMTAIKVANRVRTNFVSMVSHELRTPLNSVHGFIDLLMHGHMGELTEEQKKYLGYAQEGVQQLMNIVEDILFLTRSDSGQFEMKPEEVNLRVLAKQVVTSLKIQATGAYVVLEKDIPSPTPILYADPQRMKQVLNNLVTNAIKFTPPGGTVTIRSRPFNDQFVLISVEDTGYGIAQEDQQHIFERFYQSNHAQQSKMGGYGLGLPIAKLIVEQHGGEIGFDTHAGQGTVFHFTAPLHHSLEM